MKAIILGTGPLGMAVMEAEAAKGNELTLINRSGLVREQLPPGVQVIKADIFDEASLLTICPPADVVYHCAGTPEPWSEAVLTRLLESAIALAASRGALLVWPDHLFAYGDANGIPISESSPELANTGPAGVMLKKIAHSLLDRHFAGKVRAVIARSPIAYGPRVLSGPLGREVFTRLLQHKDALMLGSLDLPHSFGYIKDMGRNLSLLAEHPEASGKVWHLPCGPALTQQQILDILRDMLSRTVHAHIVTRPRGLGGIFSREHRVWETILYQFEKPFVWNHTRFATTFGERCTSHPQAMWETLEWYRRHGMGI